MKYLILLALAFTACKSHPVGGPPFVVCGCRTDTLKQSYGLTNTYVMSDSLRYKDSCSALQARYGWDSCHVLVLAL